MWRLLLLNCPNYLVVTLLFLASVGHATGLEPSGRNISSNSGIKAVPPKKTSDEKRKPQSNGIEIMPLDSEFPTQYLRNSGYRVGPYDQQNGRPRTSEILDPQMRDQIFQEVGLSRYVSGWDHLERDILFLRAQQQSFDELRIKYPGLPRASLQRLVNLMQSGGGR